MKNKLEEAFDNYVKNFDMNNKAINFKYRHSYKVKELMRNLAIKLNLSPKEIEVAEVIGLLHDIGRFEQIRKYNLCSDCDTNVDHADESCIYLFDKGHIKDFYDDSSYYDIIKDAVKEHNKYSINPSIKDKNLLFTKMIRDMDKVDIYRVLFEEFVKHYNKDEVSSNVLEQFNNRELVNYENRKSDADEIFGYLSYLFDINFVESYEMLRNNNLKKYFDSIVVVDNSKDSFDKLKEEIYLYVDNKIETNK